MAFSFSWAKLAVADDSWDYSLHYCPDLARYAKRALFFLERLVGIRTWKIVLSEMRAALQRWK